MVRGIHIPARITHQVTERQFEKLDDYQAGVGGNIEAVDLRLIDSTMYVNEEGHVHGLEFNPRATMLWWYWVPEARQKAMLVGDAVLVGWPDDEGNSTDLPQQMLGVILEADEFRIEVQWRSQDDWAVIYAPLPYIDYFDAMVWALILMENTRPRPHQLKVVSTVVASQQPGAEAVAPE